MTAMEILSEHSSPLLEKWRGSAEIWTPETYHLSLGCFAKVRAGREEIEVSLPKKKVSFSPEEVLEARTFRFPLPSMTLIFSLGGDRHGLVSLFCFRRHLREELVQVSGLSLIDQRTWRTGFEAGRDEKRYGLQS